jgi:large subunit ribosomal protein L13
MTTTRSIKKDELKKEWYIVDAKDQVLGRLCSNVSKILLGKHKPSYTSNVDTGDFVIVLNANKIKATGKKPTVKTYDRYTGYPGGLRTKKFSDLIQHNPGEIIENAIRGMLPKSKLGRVMIKKLKVYAGDKHPHSAQSPKLITVTKVTE